MWSYQNEYFLRKKTGKTTLLFHNQHDTNEQNGREIFQLVSAAMRVGDNNISAVWAKVSTAPDNSEGTIGDVRHNPGLN